MEGSIGVKDEGDVGIMKSMPALRHKTLEYKLSNDNFHPGWEFTLAHFVFWKEFTL
jgi:hypothetical protein